MISTIVTQLYFLIEGNILFNNSSTQLIKLINLLNKGIFTIGIAIKDSSNVTIKNLNVRESEKCINVYRKKQEFSGAIVNLKVVNYPTLVAY